MIRHRHPGGAAGERFMLQCDMGREMGIHESCQRASGPARLGLRRLRLAAAGGLVLATLALYWPATAHDANQAQDLKPNPWSLCAKATNLIERQEGIPRQLLRAISKVESGRFHKKKQLVMAWPWTVMPKAAAAICRPSRPPSPKW